MQATITGFSLAVILFAAAGSAIAEDASHCTSTAPPDLKIPSCQWVIASGVQRKDILIAAHGGLGDAYFAKGYGLEMNGSRAQAAPLYRKAVSEFSAAIALDPNGGVNYRNYVFRGVVHNALGEFDLAIADDTRAISMMPTDPHPYFSRGLVYRRMGRKDEARADFAKAHQLDPSMAVPSI